MKTTIESFERGKRWYWRYTHEGDAGRVRATRTFGPFTDEKTADSIIVALLGNVTDRHEVEPPEETHVCANADRQQ